ncbi:hypothetical protein GCM10027422_40300 [Hymenobacter arcticus]
MGFAGSQLGGCRSERPPAYFAPGATLAAPIWQVPVVGPVDSPRLAEVAPAYPSLRNRQPRPLRIAKQLISKRFLTHCMISPLPPRTHAQSTAEEKTPTTFKASSLIVLSGVLVAVGGILLGIALGGAWVLLTGGLGLAAGVVLGMLGLFGALSNDSRSQIRFSGIMLLGLLVALAGVVLGVSVGGLLGVGVGLLLLGLGSLVTGWGILK